MEIVRTISVLNVVSMFGNKNTNIVIIIEAKKAPLFALIYFMFNWYILPLNYIIKAVNLIVSPAGIEPTSRD